MKGFHDRQGPIPSRTIGGGLTSNLTGMRSMAISTGPPSAPLVSSLLSPSSAPVVSSSQIVTAGSGLRFSARRPLGDTNPRDSESLYVGVLSHNRLPQKSPLDSTYTEVNPNDSYTMEDGISSKKPGYFFFKPNIPYDDQEPDAKLSSYNDDVAIYKLCEDLLKKSKDNTVDITVDDSDDEDGSSVERTHKKVVSVKTFVHMGFPDHVTMVNKIKYTTLCVGLDPRLRDPRLFFGELQNGCIRMTIPATVMRSLATTSNMLGSNMPRYHWKPLHIRMIEEQNGLPIAFNLQMVTNIPDTATAQNRKQEWISTSGPNMWGGGDTLPMLNHVTLPGTRRLGDTQHASLYVADQEVLNAVEANRWLGVSEDTVNDSLSKYAYNTGYSIPLPPDNQYIASDPVQYVAITELPRLIELSKLMNADTPYVIKESSRRSLFVGNGPLTHVIRQKFEMYNKSKFLMKADSIEFVLTPVHQNLKDMDLEAYLGSPDVARTRYDYFCKIEISYEEWGGTVRDQPVERLMMSNGFNHPLSVSSSSSSSVGMRQSHFEHTSPYPVRSPPPVMNNGFPSNFYGSSGYTGV